LPVAGPQDRGPEKGDPSQSEDQDHNNRQERTAPNQPAWCNVPTASQPRVDPLRLEDPLVRSGEA
jgi:hypothetical protein